MINDFTDRRPRLSALIIFALFTVVPTAAMLIVDVISGGAVHMPVFIFVYALLLQTVMWLTIERPILVFMPFIMALVGFIAAEIIYTVSESSFAPGAGVGAAAYLISSVIVTVFGAEAAASVGAMICAFVIRIARKLWDAAFHK